MNFSRYRVKPGSKVKLKNWDPADKTGVPSAKQERVARLVELSEEINRLQDLLYAAHEAGVLIVLQGLDTAGKDGTIRHVFRAVDPLGVRAVAFKVPTPQELGHDFLWRVHQQVPSKGEMVIFNRSHYEDVLVPRVHGWITISETRRRYERIEEFERLLVDNATLVLKFFLYISKDEQRRRLQERIDVPEKRWKFNPTDLEARTLWKQYMQAYENALAATSTDYAPWYVIPADSKTTRDLIVSHILIEQLRALDLAYPKPKIKLEGIVVE
jgi:PPK2 family polyphosphate:nucleotide phosphotransferase